MTELSPTFCALPFGHLFLSEEGKSYPCCYALETGAVNRDEAGTPISLAGGGSLETAWNSPTQRKIRRQLRAGEKPAACDRCFALEEHGLQSLRQVSNRRFEPQARAALAATDASGALPPHLYSLDVRLGNLCNLRCQMCSPVSSARLVEEFRRLYPEGDFAAYEKMSWQKEAGLPEKIVAWSEDLLEAHFAGGEPFLIPEVETVVRALATSPRAKKIRLSFNTNGTLLPERLLELFCAFESVRLIVSVDGLGAVNDFIRFPSRFSTLERNLQRLHENRARWNLTYVCFNVTVQAHNVLQLPEIIRYLTREFPGFLPFPVLGPLLTPACLSAQTLPRERKAEAVASLLRLVRDEEEFWASRGSADPTPGAAERFAGHVRGVADFLLAADLTEHLPEQRRFVAVLAEKRGPAPYDF